ncbi:hypothetical protein [Azospirillum sp.]|uniref:hypothetical protein n=1 Tax=Azospirillum sp. TaxID=34012 RepID=UPI003D758663
MTEKQEENPVRCRECGWIGDAVELGHEGECGGEGCSPSSVVPITEPADLIDAWLDSEGSMCGPTLARAGLIYPRPATAEEAEDLDLETGDTVWDLTAEGNALLAKKAA